MQKFAQGGGLATKKKYGVEFYKRISKMGVKARKVKKGKEYQKLISLLERGEKQWQTL